MLIDINAAARQAVGQCDMHAIDSRHEYKLYVF